MNKETKQAIQEAKKGKVERYKNLNDLYKKFGEINIKKVIKEINKLRK